MVIVSQTINFSASPYDLLRLQFDLGIDEAVADAPDSWPLVASASTALSSIATPKGAEQPSVKPLTATALPVSLAKEAEKVRAMADAATTLADLEASVRAFDGCQLKRTATNTVFARGNPASGIMLIGEAPGAEEDKMGIPFCGASGQLLDTMLEYIGLCSPNDFYVTNTIFWRPPGNRQPTSEEIALCKPYVERHISLIHPKLIILVGGVSTKALLERDEGITRLRNKTFEYKNQYMEEAVPVRAMFHPSYLLRQPLAKRDAWSDLLEIRSALSS